MSARLKPYKGATLIARKSGKIKAECANKGKEATIEHYSAYASLGYKSKYDRIVKHWLCVSIEGERTQTYSFTGKRIAEAERDFASASAMIE